MSRIVPSLLRNAARVRAAVDAAVPVLNCTNTQSTASDGTLKTYSAPV